MKTIIMLAAITLSGCLHDKQFTQSLYCDGVYIATGEFGFSVYDNYYKYKVNGQVYRYTAIEGSVCKIVEVE
jgi:hypothetical protein